MENGKRKIEAKRRSRDQTLVLNQKFGHSGNGIKIDRLNS